MKDQSRMAVSRTSSSTGSFAILPEDMVFRIFLLLPVACLLRLKLVCKSFLSFIESSAFINCHIRHSYSEDNQENKLIIFNMEDRFRFTGEKFISVMDFPLSEIVDFKINTDEMVSGVHLIASFNGIICLTHSLSIGEVTQAGLVRNMEEDIMSIDSITVVSLWNPATKQVKILPPPLKADRSVKEGGDYRTDYGFGFDVKTNDYRVVKVIVGGITKSNQLKSHVQVYSLNTDSWRVIDAAVPLKIWIESSPKRPFMNGIYCWYGRDYTSKDPAILSFDFCNEVFGTIPMFDDYGGMKVFTFLREKLACINWDPDDSSSEEENENCLCQVWVLEKCGVNESWTNLYTFMLEPQIFPKGFSANDKMVLKNKKYGDEVVLCLLDLATLKYIEILYQGTISEVAVYKESLVSVKGANGETYRADNEWKTISSTWDLAVSQWIMGSHDSFAGILHEDAGGLVVFNEPKMAPRVPAQPIAPTRWSPPLAGTIKLNTDAMLDRRSGLGTVSFVARNAAGIAVKAFCSNPVPMTCIFKGKGEAIRNALSDALYAGWESIIVESDSRKVMNTIKGSIAKGSSDQSTSFFSVTEINTLSAHFKSISFCSLPRDLNAAAQSLASHGFTCDKPCIWETQMPDWLNDVLARDLVG